MSIKNPRVLNLRLPPPTPATAASLWDLCGILQQAIWRECGELAVAVVDAVAGRRFTHVRLNIFPDGGVARLRVLGDVAPDPNVTALARLNALAREEALAAMRSFCASLKWAERMADARPFEARAGDPHRGGGAGQDPPAAHREVAFGMSRAREVR